MSKSIHEIIKESIIKEFDASNITAGNLTKALIESKGEFHSLLDTILEELAEEEEFTPEFGDVYWIIDGEGEAAIQKWIDDSYDKGALANNAIFETQEAAEFEAERLKVLRELEKLGRAFKPFEKNYSVSLEYRFLHKEELVIIFTEAAKHLYGKYYFDTEEEAQEAINKIGADRIKKYLFGAEE